jgi:hypothetical protein
MAEAAYSEDFESAIEQAANDLIEATGSAPAIHDPGTFEGDTPAESRSRSGLIAVS